MIRLKSHKKLSIIGQRSIHLTLALVTISFWFGIFIWLTDGAWENGALPTHAIHHMIAGFLGCWLCYLCIRWVQKMIKNRSTFK